MLRGDCTFRRLSELKILAEQTWAEIRGKKKILAHKKAKKIFSSLEFFLWRREKRLVSSSSFPRLICTSQKAVVAAASVANFRPKKCARFCKPNFHPEETYVLSSKEVPKKNLHTTKWNWNIPDVIFLGCGICQLATLDWWLPFLSLPESSSEIPKEKEETENWILCFFLFLSLSLYSLLILLLLQSKHHFMPLTRTDKLLKLVSKTDRVTAPNHQWSFATWKLSWNIKHIA